MPAPEILVTDLDDLREYVASPGPFFTMVIPARSDVADAAHRFDVRWKQARRDLSDDWTDERVAAVTETLAGIGHGGGDALVVAHSDEGGTFAEFISGEPDSVRVLEGALPALVPVIEARQRTIPHIVVETDRAGADITAFDGGVVLDRRAVDGEELHIHRGHPGGWSQRRFQQRAENTWETNADSVAEATAAMATSVGAMLVAVSGPVRARSMVADELERRNVSGVVRIEAGDPDGVAAEVVTMVDTAHAATITALADTLRTQLSADGAVSGIDATLDALREGRVDTLLVNDDWSNQVLTDSDLSGVAPGSRAIDAAVVTALATGADVVVVPSLAAMSGPLAAILRW